MDSCDGAIDLCVLSNGDQPCTALPGQHKRGHTVPRIGRAGVAEQLHAYVGDGYILAQETHVDLSKPESAGFEDSVVPLLVPGRTGRDGAVGVGMTHLDGLSTFPPLSRYVDKIGIGRKELPEGFHVVSVPRVHKTAHSPAYSLFVTGYRKKAGREGSSQHDKRKKQEQEPVHCSHDLLAT